MSPLPLSPQTLARLKHAADSGQFHAIVILHLLGRADKRDQDVAAFLDSYTATIAALCRRLEALERGAKDLPALAAPGPTPPPAASAGGLVKRVANAIMEGGTLPHGITYAAIREVAAWLDTRGQHGCSALLREEIER